MLRSSPFSFLLLLSVSAALTFPARAQDPTYVDTWSTALMAAPAGDAGKADQTLREIVHVSTGSNQFTSVVFSNEFGVEPLTVGAASIALRASSQPAGNIGKPVALTFGSKPGVVIPPGRSVSSDIVAFAFPAMSDVAISVFVPAQPITVVTQHSFANATNYAAPGNQVTSMTLNAAKETAAWLYVKTVDVSSAADGGLIVCLGDSITDGSKSTKDANLRWPDLLEHRLQQDHQHKGFADFGVVNEGIGGNRILRDVTGPSAISRFDRDVLQHLGQYQSPARFLIILEGINDIGHAYDPIKHYDKVTADELIAGYRLLIVRAHANGLKVIGATLTPYVGAKYASPDGEKVRQALNQWIRTTKDLDGVIDFDKATRDPASPGQFLAAYDSGDHLHPNDAGMKAMAESIDLNLFLH